MEKEKIEKFRELKKRMKKDLTKSRYEHVIGVEYTAASLAMRYGGDLEDAAMAGLMHDCAKCLSGDELISLCKKYNLPVSAAEEQNPYLLHGKVGAYFCRNKYQIDSPGILSAITFHTTGKPGMSLLEKIIYVADYIEPHRDKAPNLEYLRKMSFIDIDEAVYQIAKDTLEYLDSTRKDAVDHLTWDTYEYYKSIHKLKKEHV